MEIKTVVYRLDNAEEFDAEVNAALAEGWNLVKRDTIRPYQPHTCTASSTPCLYAELVKMPQAEPQEEPVTWQEAVQVIRQECDSHTSCLDCPATDVCNHYPPSLWEMGRLEGSDT